MNLVLKTIRLTPHFVEGVWNRLVEATTKNRHYTLLSPLTVISTG